MTPKQKATDFLRERPISFANIEKAINIAIEEQKKIMGIVLNQYQESAIRKEEKRLKQVRKLKEKISANFTDTPAECLIDKVNQWIDGTFK